MSLTIHRMVQDWLMMRDFSAGETVQFGWFIFRIASNEKPPKIETLDFKAIASFTSDFTEVEKIHTDQQAALRANGLEEEPCTLQQSAIVSLSYAPSRAKVFLKRDDSAKGNASGWYVGVEDEELDMNDVDSFALKSLYELSIYDKRMLPYWLLPPVTTVFLDTDVISRS